MRARRDVAAVAHEDEQHEHRDRCGNRRDEEHAAVGFGAERVPAREQEPAEIFIEQGVDRLAEMLEQEGE